MSSSSPQTPTQSFWQEQYDALRGAAVYADSKVKELRTLYPTAGPEQTSILEQSYQRHMETVVQLNSFINDTPADFLRLASQADRIAADPTKSPQERLRARSDSILLQSSAAEFSAARAAGGWTKIEEVRYRIGQTTRFTTPTGIMERIDPGLGPGRLLASVQLWVQDMRTQLASGEATVQQMRERGIPVPNDHEICEFVLGRLKDRALSALFPVPEALKDLPPAAKIYKDGVQSTVEPQVNACKLILDKKDFQEFLRLYGLADDPLLQQLDSLAFNQLTFNVSLDTWTQSVALDSALSNLGALSPSGPAAFESQLDAIRNRLTSNAAFQNEVTRSAERSTLAEIDGAVFGDNQFDWVGESNLQVRSVINGQPSVLVASLNLDTANDAGPGPGWQFDSLQTAGQPAPDPALFELEKQIHDIQGSPGLGGAFYNSLTAWSSQLLLGGSGSRVAHPSGHASAVKRRAHAAKVGHLIRPRRTGPPDCDIDMA